MISCMKRNKREKIFLKLFPPVRTGPQRNLVTVAEDSDRRYASNLTKHKIEHYGKGRDEPKMRKTKSNLTKHKIEHSGKGGDEPKMRKTKTGAWIEYSAPVRKNQWNQRPARTKRTRLARSSPRRKIKSSGSGTRA
jgi:hypothetical protein